MYVLDEVKMISGGFYEGYLNNTDVNMSSVQIYSEPKMTGRKITNYSIRREGVHVKLHISGIDGPVYATYETTNELIDTPREEDDSVEFDMRSYVETIMSGKADKNRTYTKDEVDTKFGHVRGPKGDQGEKGDKGDIGPKGPKGEPGDAADSIAWSKVTGKPTSFKPSAHKHPISDVDISGGFTWAQLKGGG